MMKERHVFYIVCFFLFYLYARWKSKHKLQLGLTILTCEGQTCFSCLSSCSKSSMPMICTTRIGKDHSKFGQNRTSSLTCKSLTRFYIIRSTSHFVQRDGTIHRYAHLGLVMITLTKFGWNRTISLTCKSRKMISFLFFSSGSHFCAEKRNVQRHAQV